MACDKCEDIADDIVCQGCSDDIIDDCEKGDCDADSIINRGEVNGHPLSIELIKKYSK